MILVDKEKTKDLAFWFSMNATFLVYPDLNWNKIEQSLKFVVKSPAISVLQAIMKKTKVATKVARKSSSFPSGPFLQTH